jgi:hypothetical protein
MNELMSPPLGHAAQSLAFGLAWKGTALLAGALALAWATRRRAPAAAGPERGSGRELAEDVGMAAPVVVA